MRDGHPKANGFWGQLELATIRVGALGNRQPNEIQYGDLEFGEVSGRTSSGGGGVELSLFVHSIIGSGDQVVYQSALHRRTGHFDPMLVPQPS
mmetsp:Transcript_52195/g.52574  ORF Transcript_52195/g.52574 Transcript_52195/m.52574 type:complete len:93 (-) Transcript_52195:629-907(-)